VSNPNRPRWQTLTEAVQEAEVSVCQRCCTTGPIDPSKPCRCKYICDELCGAVEQHPLAITPPPDGWGQADDAEE
jgi:hypothetical protein